MSNTKPGRRGRPRKTFRVVKVLVSLPVGLRNTLRAHCDRDGRTRSAVVTRALEEYLGKRGTE